MASNRLLVIACIIILAFKIYIFNNSINAKLDIFKLEKCYLHKRY